jgi:hypothetical protein
MNQPFSIKMTTPRMIVMKKLRLTIIADRGLDPERISFVDRAVEARIYLYSVTAIDEAGNESAPARPMRVDLSPGEEH